MPPNTETAEAATTDEATTASPPVEAQYGFKKDGTPKRKTGRPRKVPLEAVPVSAPVPSATRAARLAAVHATVVASTPAKEIEVPEEVATAEEVEAPEEPDELAEESAVDKPRIGRPPGIPNPAKPKIPRPARLNRWQTMERRGHVAKLQMQGVTSTQIAKILGIAQSTVLDIFKQLKQEHGQILANFDKHQFIGQKIEHFANLREKAWREFNAAPDPKIKLKALDLVRTLHKDEIAVLVDTGVIIPDRAPVQVVDHQHTLQLNMTAEMRTRIANAMLSSALKTPLAEPTPEVIDVAATPLGTGEPPVFDAEDEANAESQDEEATSQTTAELVESP